MATLPNPNQLQTALPRFGGVTTVQSDTSIEQATERLGQVVAGLGEEIHRQKVENDKYEVEEATTRMRNRQLDLAKGNPELKVQGYREMRGEAVVKDKQFFEKEMDRFNTMADEIADSLANDDQRALFQRRRDVISLAHKEDLVDHTTKEHEAYKTQVYQTGISSEVNFGIENYDNDNLLGTSKAAIINMTRNEAERTGQPFDALLETNLNNFHSSVIDSALLKGDYGRAQEYFNTHKKELTGKDRLTAEAAVKKGALKSESMDIVDDYMAKDMSETDALKTANKIKKVELRDEVKQRLKIRYSEQLQAQDRAQKQAGETLDFMYEDGLRNDMTPQEAWDAIPDKIKEGMDGGELGAARRRMEADAMGKSIKTDPDKWYEFEDALQSGDITDANQLMQYKNWFSPSDMKLARKKFDKRGSVSTTDMMRAFTDHVGKSRSKWSTKEKEQWMAFQDYILDKVRETRRPEDVTVWADRWFMGGENDDTSLFVDDPDTFGEAVVEGRAKDFRIEVPEEEKASVMSIMQGVGVNAQDEKQRSIFYTEQYQPATDYLRSHQLPINDKSIAAVTILRMGGKVVNPDTINIVMKRIR